MNRMCKSPSVLFDSFCIEVEGVIAVHDLVVVNEEPVPISSSNINAFERIQQVQTSVTVLDALILNYVSQEQLVCSLWVSERKFV